VRASLRGFSSVLSRLTFDHALAPLGERVEIPKSRESRVRGSAEAMMVKNYVGHDARWGAPAPTVASEMPSGCSAGHLRFLESDGLHRNPEIGLAGPYAAIRPSLGWGVSTQPTPRCVPTATGHQRLSIRLLANHARPVGGYSQIGRTLSEGRDGGRSGLCPFAKQRRHEARPGGTPEGCRKSGRRVCRNSSTSEVAHLALLWRAGKVRPGVASFTL
jgi:hypothetical protein